MWPYPVVVEPPLPAFARRAGSVLDDGRKPTLLSSALRRLSNRLAPQERTRSPESEPAEETPEAFERDEVEEYQAHLPAGLRFDLRTHTALFGSISGLSEPVAFEVVGTPERIVAQFAAHPRDARHALSQWKAAFPEVGFAPAPGFLAGLWDACEDAPTAAAEFGLAREFMLPLRQLSADPFVGLAGALSEIGEGELGIFQVLFSPASPRWRERMIRSLTHGDGSALFVNAPELLPAARAKASSALFGAVVRIAARALSDDRAWEIACNMAASLEAFGSPDGNELTPLRNDGYPADEHAFDVVRRQCRRSGMLINAEELAGFVHLPSDVVKSPRLRTNFEKTNAAPVSMQRPGGLMLGENAHAGMVAPVFLSEEQRVRHIHIVGASGTGKSTLLFNLIRQDMESGRGCSVLDPHGDLIDRVLGVVPEKRIDDVVLLDPSDENYAIGFNVLAAHSDGEKALLASDLVAVFRRLSTSWGDQLNSVLSNALLAFMESERGGTLFDVRRFLLEPKFRADFLKSVRDPNVLYYWRHAFPMLTGNRSVGPVVTRLDAFLSAKPIRHMVGQNENRLDFGDILDSRRIFLAKLPEGVVGKENAHLLGSLLVSKMQAAAMARQRERESARQFHALYADEFHSFLTPSLAECLSGVRKYRLGLALVHQEMRQVERDPDVASALLNAGTRIVFRVNDRDSRALEGGFSSFEARDLQNLSTGHAVCRVERSDYDFNLAVRPVEEMDEDTAHERRERVAATSRAKYGTLRAEIDRTFAVEVDPLEPEVKASPAKRTLTEPVQSTTVPAVPSPKSEPPPVTVPVSTEPPVVRVPVPSEAVIERTPLPPADLGRGGAQHKAIQDRIKEEAEKLGFRVAVEKEVLGGAGQIDLVLSRGDVAIACEVTVTNSVDYEIGNVSKCIKAGYRSIAVVAVSEEKLAKLSAAVANSLGQEAAQWTSFHMPDAFIAALKKMPETKQAEPEPMRRTRGGRVVKRKVVTLSPEEAKAKEEEALQLMAQMMKQKNRRE